MAYRIEFRPSAYREFKKLSRDIQERIAEKMDSLARNPLPPASEKLTGKKNRYRLRTGDYRIVYEIRKERLLVLVVRIAHRRDVYRK